MTTGWAWLWAPVGAERRAAADTLRTAGIAGPERDLRFSRRIRRPIGATRPDNPWAASPDPRFPHVLTTSRLTEHHTAGGMSRTLSHLAELQPALFCELSPELAREVGVRHGATIRIVTARGDIRARALVTGAHPSPDRAEVRTVHQIALPWHFGHKGLVTGDVANDLVAMSEEPNVRVVESKALLCRIETTPDLSENPHREDVKG